MTTPTSTRRDALPPHGREEALEGLLCGGVDELGVVKVVLPGAAIVEALASELLHEVDVLKGADPTEGDVEGLRGGLLGRRPRLRSLWPKMSVSMIPLKKARPWAEAMVLARASRKERAR